MDEAFSMKNSLNEIKLDLFSMAANERGHQSERIRLSTVDSSAGKNEVSKDIQNDYNLFDFDQLKVRSY